MFRFSSFRFFLLTLGLVLSSLSANAELTTEQRYQLGQARYVKRAVEVIRTQLDQNLESMNSFKNSVRNFDSSSQDVLSEMTYDALSMVHTSLRIFDWRYSDRPEGWEMNDAPDGARRAKESMFYESFLEALKQKNPVMAMPVFKNLTVKKPWEFLIFSIRPTYYIYHKVFARYLESRINLINETLFNGKNVIKNVEKLALYLNIDQIEVYDQSDKMFDNAKKIVKYLIDDLEGIFNIATMKQNRDGYFQSQFLRITQNEVTQLVDKFIDRAEKAKRHLRKDVDWRLPESRLVRKLDSYLEYYSFIAYLDSLPSTLSDNLPENNLFTLKSFGKDLLDRAMDKEHAMMQNKFSNWLYGLGFLAMFCPYNRVTSPALFSLAAGQNLLMHELPAWGYVNRMNAIFSALYLPFKTGENRVKTLVGYREYEAREQIVQERKASLGFSIGFEVPFIMIPSLIKLNKNLKTLPIKQPKQMLGIWKQGYKEAFLRLLGEEGIKGLSRSAMIRTAAVNILKDTNFRVAAFYFTSLLGIQIYQDIKREKNADERQQYQIDPFSHLSFDQSKRYLENRANKRAFDRKIAEMKALLRSWDEKADFPYMRPVYHSDSEIDFDLHDGEDTFMVFNTVFLPLSKVRTESAQDLLLRREVIQTIVSQTIVETELVQNMSEDVLEKIVTQFLSQDRADSQYATRMLLEQFQSLVDYRLVKERMASQALEKGIEFAALYNELSKQ